MAISTNKKKAIENLSNMIFGLALSIGSLTLITSTNLSPQAVVNAITTFAFGFATLILIWFRYNTVLDRLKGETNAELWLNIAMLFFVVIEPYLFNLLHNPGTLSQDFTTGMYGLDIAGMLAVLGMIYGLAYHESGRKKDAPAIYLRTLGIGLFVSGIIFGVSTIPIFWQVALAGVNFRYVLWFVALFLGVVYRKMLVRRLRG